MLRHTYSNWSRSLVTTKVRDYIFNKPTLDRGPRYRRPGWTLNWLGYSVSLHSTRFIYVNAIPKTSSTIYMYIWTFSSASSLRQVFSWCYYSSRGSAKYTTRRNFISSKHRSTTLADSERIVDLIISISTLSKTVVVLGIPRRIRVTV